MTSRKRFLNLRRGQNFYGRVAQRYILLFDEIICSTYSSNFHANRTDRFFQLSIDCIVKAVLE